MNASRCILNRYANACVLMAVLHGRDLTFDWVSESGNELIDWMKILLDFEDSFTSTIGGEKIGYFELWSKLQRRKFFAWTWTEEFIIIYFVCIVLNANGNRNETFVALVLANAHYRNVLSIKMNWHTKLSMAKRHLNFQVDLMRCHWRLA